MNQKTIFIAAAAALLLIFVVATQFHSSNKETQTTQLADTNREALVRMHSPTLGNPNAPVVIVEFLDPACETCRVFYPLVKDILAAHPDQIRLVLRYAPFHNGSDKVVAVLEAARKQGKFWPALEALLATQADWSPNHTPQVERVWQHLEGIGLDLEQMRIDMNAPEIAALIAQDLADAETLKVNKTPDFFVNGKPLTTFGHEPLRALVAEALSEVKQK